MVSALAARIGYVILRQLHADNVLHELRVVAGTGRVCVVGVVLLDQLVIADREQVGIAL